MKHKKYTSLKFVITIDFTTSCNYFLGNRFMRNNKPCTKENLLLSFLLFYYFFGFRHSETNKLQVRLSLYLISDIAYASPRLLGFAPVTDVEVRSFKAVAYKGQRGCSPLPKLFYYIYIYIFFNNMHISNSLYDLKISS